MLAEATAQTNELVNEHEIMQRAYAQANEIIEQAQAHSFAKSTVRPAKLFTSTFGMSFVTSFNILTRSSTENNGVFARLLRTPMIR